MGQHPFQLDAAQLVEQALGDHQGGIPRPAPARQRIRSGVGEDDQQRLGQAGGRTQPLDQVVEAGLAVGVGRRTAHPAQHGAGGLPAGQQCRSADEHDGEEEAHPRQDEDADEAEQEAHDGDLDTHECRGPAAVGSHLLGHGGCDDRRPVA